MTICQPAWMKWLLCSLYFINRLKKMLLPRFPCWQNMTSAGPMHRSRRIDKSEEPEKKSANEQEVGASDAAQPNPVGASAFVSSPPWSRRVSGDYGHEFLLEKRQEIKTRTHGEEHGQQSEANIMFYKDVRPLWSRLVFKVIHRPHRVFSPPSCLCLLRLTEEVETKAAFFFFSICCFYPVFFFYFNLSLFWFISSPHASWRATHTSEESLSVTLEWWKLCFWI